MSSLPARILFSFLLPATLGGVAARWITPGTQFIQAPDRPALPVQITPAAHFPSAPPSAAPSGRWLEQRQFIQRLMTARLPEMIAMLDEAVANPDDSLRRHLLALVMEQMARTDPDQSLAFLETWQNGNYRHPFLKAWAQVDAAAALTWAEGQGKDADSYVKTLVESLIPDHIPELAKILPRLKPDLLTRQQVTAAFRRIAADDPATAVRLLAGLGDGIHRLFGTSAAGEGWARRDLPAAYAWAASLTNPAQRESALRSVLRVQAETDPQAAAARLNELTQDSAIAGSAAGDSPVHAVIQALATQDPKAAVAWLKDNPAATGSRLQEFFISGILGSRKEWKPSEITDLTRQLFENKVLPSSGEAAEFNAFSSSGTSGHPVEDTHHRRVGKFGGSSSPFRHHRLGTDGNPAFHIADPAAAFEELSTQPADTARQEVLHEVAVQWAKNDPAGALEKLQQTTDPWLKLGLINALSNLAHQSMDVEMAAHVAGFFPEGSAGRRTDFLTNFYLRLAANDPGRAAQLLNTAPGPDIIKPLASALAEHQAAYDPAGAMDWAVRQPDEAAALAASRSAIGVWARSDAYAASEWLAGQSPGPLRDAAVESFSSLLRQDAPEDALKWAATLSDQSKRENLQWNIVSGTISQDVDKARQMATQLNLSEELSRQLWERIEQQEKRVK